MKYRRIPEKPVEAIKFNGNHYEIFVFIHGLKNLRDQETIRNSSLYKDFESKCLNQKSFIISTPNGDVICREGDYVIEATNKEIYTCSPDIFELHYEQCSKSNVAEFHEFAHKQMPVKSLHNKTSNIAEKNVKDIEFWGNRDIFKLISKSSSESEGWIKSTKAMEIPKIGCVVQVTTQQRNPDGSYSVAEALTFVPNARVEFTLNKQGEVVSRKLVY